jgi:AcrR family transcriptional regulator
MTERSEHAALHRRPRRRRDPQRTREAILDAAQVVLAQDGKEGMSIAAVAQRAGVNRGTAYQHFRTREQLIEATVAWVSEKLCRAVFGTPAVGSQQPVASMNVEGVMEHLAQFPMENPEIGRVWLFELLSSKNPAQDPFWRQFVSNFEKLARTELAQPGIDAEVVSVLMLAGTFLWQVWACAHSRTAQERQQMATRLSREMLRLSLYGTLRPEKFPKLNGRIGKKAAHS